MSRKREAKIRGASKESRVEKRGKREINSREEEIGRRNKRGEERE